MPLTLRLIFHTIRAAWTGVLLALTAWVGLASVTPQERQALGAEIGTERPAGLVPMRIATAMVHFAPERAARMLSNASNGEISPELAGMMLRQIAKGPATDIGPQTRPASQDDSTGRDSSSAKFIAVN